MLRDQVGSAREALARTQQVMTSWGSHPQRGKDRGSGCPPRALRVPWLLVRPAPLSQGWPLVSRASPSKESVLLLKAWVSDLLFPGVVGVWSEFSDHGHSLINLLWIRSSTSTITVHNMSYDNRLQ